jgi:hypothetical protein
MKELPHLVPLPQQRQFMAVDGTLHHMDVIVLDTEVQVPKPEHHTGKRVYNIPFTVHFYVDTI